MENLLQIDSIQKSFGERKILRSVYLESRTGNITALLGRNGSGKSSLFQIVMGKLATEDKAVSINGQSFYYARHPHRLLTFLPQNFHIPKRLRIIQVFRNFGLPFEICFKKFPELIGRKQERLASLSSGERRLIEVLVVIFTQSLFTILDEPFSQLMPIHIEKIKEILLEEKKRKGFIITDQIYETVMDISDLTYLLTNGVVKSVMDKTELIREGYVNRL
ncbi:MAG TPA: ATP-binding cassette domain-containing protein [Arachidicoccus sp.]|nr:ATP-binding cassette domain-containing protein [Arachidicoccus sp.]